MIREQIGNALLLGIILCLSLITFLPPEEKTGTGQRSRRKTAYTVLAIALLLAISEGTSGLRDYLFYLHFLLKSSAIVLSMQIWSRRGYLVCLQRGLAFFLMTDSLLLCLSHLSRKVLGEDALRSSPLWRNLLALALYALLLQLCLKAVKKLYPPQAQVNLQTVLLSLLSIIPYLFVRQITLWLPVQAEDITYPIVITVILSAVLSLLLSANLEKLLYAEEKRREMLLEMERSQQHYILKKNSMEAVRRQYHDMKNLLLYLEKGPSRENISAHVGKILSSMEPIETVLETGNVAADIILGEKMEVCQKKGIPCTVMFEGTAFSFIDQLDLVTILGNAMDNCIEACLSLPSESRFIRVRTGTNPGFVLLRFENSCHPSLLCQGDPPRTTKHDEKAHGYGLPNLFSAVQKYDGEISCEAKDGLFSLTILWGRQ